jgi:hypothetical protein
MSETLIEESPKKNVLKSRLCRELVASPKTAKEPWQSFAALFPELRTSALMAGDVESAVFCQLSRCTSEFWLRLTDLVTVSKHLEMCIEEAVSLNVGFYTLCSLQ